MAIKTVRSSKLSLFQSLVDDFVLDSHHQSTAPTATADRPTLDDPLIQAATVYCQKKEAGEAVTDEPPPELADHPAAQVAWTCVKLAGDLFLAKIEKRDDDAAQLEDSLTASTCDPRWVQAITQYVEFFGPSGTKGEIPYVRWQDLDDFVIEALPRNAKVGIVGDWGTGTQDAVDLLADLAKHQPDVVVHLGDIYYAGTDREASNNFLDLMNNTFDRANGRVPVYNMTGNHDMYSGGVGYYGILPKTNPSPPFAAGLAQEASYFCLRSPGGRWQLLGMDTGLHDHDPFTVSSDITYLEDTEVQWHLDKIDRFTAAGGRTILLSHHQAFSPYEVIGGAKAAKPPGEEAWNPKLLDSFRAPLEAGKIAAWLWGHEHNLAIYQPYGALERGRCLGHGAIPVFKDQYPYKDAGLPNPPQLVEVGGAAVQLPLDDTGVYVHGYAILQLDDDAGTAQLSYFVEGREAPLYLEKF